MTSSSGAVHKLVKMGLVNFDADLIFLQFHIITQNTGDHDVQQKLCSNSIDQVGNFENF